MKFLKNYLRLLFLCLLVSCLSVVGELSIADVNISTSTGCIEGSGIAKTEQRQVVSFNAIDVAGAFDIYIECQQEKRVEVTTDDNILSHIITEVKGRTLFITSGRSICPKSQLEVNISIDNIENITSSGANDISVSRVNNAKLDMTLYGSGDVKASGKTSEFVTSISGSVDLYAKDLQSKKVQISASGASEAVVYASKRLEVDISGVGDISYHGNPADVIKEISGVGEIIEK